jgi:mannose-6-phosphate isomerase-like protein (cupin superfamily)
MEIKNIMANKGTDILYGIQNVPMKAPSLPVVEKYWGDMRTLAQGPDYTVKRIFMRKGTQSSLEYHVKKEESYYIERGILKVGMRIGRAKNTSLILNEGDLFHIPVGLMHMRMAVTDCVIIETSTRDDDGDSHIVEDGTTYVHTEDTE